MQQFNGIVQNFRTEQKFKQDGNSYTLALFTVNGENVQTLANKVKNIRDGSPVVVIKTQNGKYANYDVRLDMNQPMMTNAAPPPQYTQPAYQPAPQAAPQAKVAESHDRQMSIEVQSAMAQAIQFVGVLAEAGAIPAKVLKDGANHANLLEMYCRMVYKVRNRVVANPNDDAIDFGMRASDTAPDDDAK